MYLQLRENQFAIFFPEDVHKLMIGKGTKKLVIKVRIRFQISEQMRRVKHFLTNTFFS
jgi:beta-galactosidase beta subunit